MHLITVLLDFLFALLTSFSEETLQDQLIFWVLLSSLDFCIVCVCRHQGFSPGTPVSSPPSSVNCSANKIKAKINAI